MKDKFLATVSKYGMFAPGDRVAVGVSGGADSMCLLSLLTDCASILGISVFAVHVNHGIRGAEADSDEQFVREYCMKNGIAFSAFYVNIPELAKITGDSTELCARRERYRIFESAEADKIATAHTGTDSVETMLMNLSRGTGLHGLSSIPPVRGKIVRPIIDFTREETERYCSEHNIGFVTDSTNLSDEYTRNKFRHKIIPGFTAINSAFETNALRCIELLRRDDKYLDDVAREKYSALFSACSGCIAVDELQKLGDSIGRRVLIKFLADVTDADFEMKHIDMLFDNMCEGISLTLPSGIVVCSDRVKIFIRKNLPVNDVLPSVYLSKRSSETVFFGKYKINLRFSDKIDIRENDDICVDFDKIDETLTVRSRASGDKISIPKRRCTKSLKKYFNELGIQTFDRDAIPVICDNKGIICIAGITADAARLPDKNTKSYMIIKVECDKNE